ncbi:MAG: thiamine phosphate synthase [Planctomycetota bacterium]
MITTEKARIIDANFNRAKEALRVLEDISRFSLLNKKFSHQLRNLRHEIDKLIDCKESYLTIINSRESVLDPGKSFFTQQPVQHLYDIAVSNIQRLQEGLRSLEEIYKTISVKKSNLCMKIRFATYEFAKIFLSSLSKEKIPDKLLYIIGGIKDWFSKSIYKKIIRKELFLVQFREGNKSDKDIYKYLKIFTDYAHSRGVKVIVNNRCDLCVGVSTDGVHIGSNDIPVQIARQIIGFSKYVGYTTHKIEEIEKIQSNDLVDYISFGTIFKSCTKPDRPFYGEKILKDLEKVKREKALILIGGITLNNIELLLKNGFLKLAVSYAIFHSSDPSKEIDKFLNIMYKY